VGTITLKPTLTPTLFIPNSFSPNGDGTNDVFKAYGVGILEFDGNIFDKWGELVYHWGSISDGWNGKMELNKISQNEVYVYSIRVKNECQTKFEPTRSGTVTLIK
jgi:gliding motility-associated-like protein